VVGFGWLTLAEAFFGGFEEKVVGFAEDGRDAVGEGTVGESSVEVRGEFRSVFAGEPVVGLDSGRCYCFAFSAFAYSTGGGGSRQLA
jgi:hypothetical protein